MKCNRLLLFLIVLFSSKAFTQAVFLKSGAVQPKANITRQTIDSFNKTALKFQEQTFAVVQFEKLPTLEERKILLTNDIELLDYLPQNSYQVSIRGTLSQVVLQTVKAQSLFQLTPQQKMQEYFAKGQIPSWAVQVAGTVDIWISFYKTLDAALVLQQLKGLNVDILSTDYISYQVVSLRIAPNRIPEIAALPFIEYVQPAPPKDQPLNYNSRIGARANVLNASAANGGKGLNGEGVTIGHGDNADVQAHVDFSGRLINRNASPFNAHGVHTAGTMAGAGNINELHRGYASKATVLSQSFSGIIENAPTYVQDFGMVITNNSYGNIIECDYHGTYDLASRILDQQAFDFPNLLHVFSAGNSGGSTCAPYPTGYRTVLGGYQAAKNIVTVGATNDTGQVAGFSSGGPVKDGRLKPEITAMGQGVISSWPTNNYLSNNGTSMSAPAVSGGLALLYQRYRQLNSGANPKNGLMKALLCNGAMDKGAIGPDFQNGFGWMNLLRSVEALEASRYFSNSSNNGSTTVHTFSVPANTAQLKVLLYWNDLPASVISTKNLVNDLDLEIVDPSGTLIQPKILDTSISALGNTAVNGPDRINNIEQVIINTPVAGTYMIRVKGTVVTNAQQEYFVTYDPIPVQLKITSPAGGEGLVPGENTKISWESYGQSGNAALEFSADGGSNWTTIAANININRMFFTWNVPAVATHNALVRIRKEGSSETSVSNPFTIVAQPAVSLSAEQCEDYISINWNTVPGATDYEVMMLKGDEMKPVALTTSTFYTFGGLSKDTTYFVTVRARVNGKGGRRAIAVMRQPAGGNCTGNLTDNDLKLDAILSPKSGRRGTSTELSATETVRIRIKNLDDAPISNFTVSYSINGNASVTETVTTTVAAGSTYEHVFSVPANLSAAGVYLLQTVVKNNGDVNPTNDTLRSLVKQVANLPLNLNSYYTDNVESATPATYERDTVGIATDGRYDFSRSTPFGRLRTFVNSGFAFSGTQAFTLDVNRFVSSGNTNYLYGTFNLSNYTVASDIRLDFYYQYHGQFGDAANRVWIRGSDTQPWIQAYNLDSINIEAGNFKKTASIEVSNLLAANGQNLSSSFQVRWGQFGVWPATDKEAAGGYTIDDIRLYQVANDVQLLRIEAPAVNSCDLTTGARITVSVRNSSGATLTNIPVRYRINGGNFVSEVIPSIPSKTTRSYTFNTAPSFTAFGPHTIQTVVDLTSDTFKENDTTTLIIYNEPLISTFPYLQNFEAGNGNFYTAGRRSSWDYGTPNSRKIKGAASGAKAWKTNLEGTYNDRELSYLYSPCFDISGMTAPTLSFSLALDIEDCGSALCDAAWVEYSADGLQWQKLGTAAAGTNWYNKAGGRNFWSIQNYTYWHVATQALPTGLSRLRLRFVFFSDPGVTREGVAIDDIHIYNNQNGIYEGPSLTSPITQTVSGNNWNHFTAGGKLVASIQPTNQNLGATAVQAYIANGTVRSANNQYYHHRNLTIKPANNPTDSVLVRFYFMDSETDSLLKATSCLACNKPESAYKLGVSQYTDPDKTAENGNLLDNQQGLWSFIPSSQVAKVPFDKGYYAEFKVANFSEFWLNSGGTTGQTPLPVKLMDLTATKQGNNVLIIWKVGSETDILRYEIEVARGAEALQGNQFTKIGEVASQGYTTSTRQYNFTDTETDKFGARYYRLKIINTDGTFRYSPVRAVVFEDALVWQVFPNPSQGAFFLTYQLTSAENLLARAYDAKGSLVKEYRSAATGFLQKLNVDLSANNYASGMYLLRVQAGEKEHVFKLYKQ